MAKNKKAVEDIMKFNYKRMRSIQEKWKQEYHRRIQKFLVARFNG
jgi:hypothetical protein